MFGPGQPHPINNPIAYATQEAARRQQQIAAVYGQNMQSNPPDQRDADIKAAKALTLSDVLADTDDAVRRASAAASILIDRYPKEAVDRWTIVRRKKWLRSYQPTAVQLPTAFPVCEMDWYMAGRSKRPTGILTGFTRTGHCVPIKIEMTFGPGADLTRETGTEITTTITKGSHPFAFPSPDSVFGGWESYADLLLAIERLAAS